MKNILAIPDDCFELVLAYDGRYDKSRLMPSLRIIDIRLVTNPEWDSNAEFTTPLQKKVFYDFIQNQERCFEQQIYESHSNISTRLLNREYKQELGRMADKFKLDKKTGHIEGITYKKGGYKKKNLSREDKNFSNVLGCFSLAKFHQNTIFIDGICYKSEMLWIICLWTKYCEYAIHYNDKYRYHHFAPKTATSNLPPMYLQLPEKNGVEICDIKFLKKAQRTKTGQELIKKMMKI
jgi:hypothetical protein